MSRVLSRLIVSWGIAASLECHAQGMSTNLAQWSPFIAEASQKYGVPSTWITKVMALESGGRTLWKGRPITSSAGAMGLMQIMPATYAELRSAEGLGPDPYDPHDNILAGTAYLRDLYDRYGYPGMFAAYNAGPGRYETSLKGAPLPDETRLYLSHFIKNEADTRQIPSIFVPFNPAIFVEKRSTATSIFVPISPLVTEQIDH